MLQEYRSIDPNAFMTVIDANEIIGNGFRSSFADKNHNNLFFNCKF